MTKPSASLKKTAAGPRKWQPKSKFDPGGKRRPKIIINSR